MNANDAIFSLFANTLLFEDLDGDGGFETVTPIFLYVSTTDPEFCNTISLDPDLSEIDKLQLSFVQGRNLKLEGINFTESETLLGNGKDILVNAGMIVIEEGQLLANTRSENFGELEIKGAFSLGAFRATQTLDFANKAAFDLDLNEDGVLDAQAITASLQTEVVDATLCLEIFNLSFSFNLLNF